MSCQNLSPNKPRSMTLLLSFNSFILSATLMTLSFNSSSTTMLKLTTRHSNALEPLNPPTILNNATISINLVPLMLLSTSQSSDSLRGKTSHGHMQQTKVIKSMLLRRLVVRVLSIVEVNQLQFRSLMLRSSGSTIELHESCISGQYHLDSNYR